MELSQRARITTEHALLDLLADAAGKQNPEVPELVRHAAAALIMLSISARILLAHANSPNVEWWTGRTRAGGAGAPSVARRPGPGSRF
jgi:hypothetical protein